MSIEILSTDNSTGTIYNGTWNFPSSIRGNFNILYQYLDTQPIPWMWGNNNQLVISVTDGMNTQNLIIPFNVSIGLLIDLNSAASQVQSAINSAFASLAITFPSLNRTVTVVYNSSSHVFIFTFSDLVSFKYQDSHSTINNVVDEHDNIDNGTVFTWTTIHMTTTPKYLYYKIAESLTSCNTSSSSSFMPTLVLSTSDFQLTGQSIYFPSSVTTLTIKIYRQNDTDHIVPLTNIWSIILI